jgi:hypothetical protein
MGMFSRLLRAALGLVGIALASIAPATADPGSPPHPPGPTPPVPVTPPEFVPQPSGIGNPLAQSGSHPAGILGLPDLSGYGPNVLLGQKPAPTAPGDPAAAVVPDLSALNPQYLLGQNVNPAAPGGGTPAPGLGPDPDIPGTGRIAFLHRLYEMYQFGALKGSLLGQQSPEEFAQQSTATRPPPPG